MLGRCIQGRFRCKPGALFCVWGASVLTVGGQVKVIQHKIPKIQGGFAQKAFFLAHQLPRLFASRKAAPGFLCNNTVKLQNSDIILRKAESLACRGLHCRPASGAGKYFLGQQARRRCGGIFLGQQARQRRAEPSPAPTAKLRNGDKIQTHSLAAYCRGGALLHPGGLGAAQGFGGRAMLAPTMKF